MKIIYSHLEIKIIVLKMYYIILYNIVMTSLTYTSPFFLHMDMDGNIPPNIGENEYVAMNNFKNYIIDPFLTRNSDNQELKQMFESFTEQNIADLNKLDSKNYSESKNSINNMQKLDKFEIYAKMNDYLTNLEGITKKCNEFKMSVKSGNEFEFVKELLYENIDQLVKLLDKMKKHFFGGVDFLLDCLNIFKDKDKIFFPSGWKTPEGGHLIGLFMIKQTDSEKYTVIITNSGSGVNNHNVLENKYQVICEIKDMLIDDVLKLIVLSRAHKKPKYSKNISKIDLNERIWNAGKSQTLIELGAGEVVDEYNELVDKLDNILDEKKIMDYIYGPEILNENNYYGVLKSILDIKKCRQDEWTYALPQLSGSCTFYGILYMIRYICNIMNVSDLFEQFYEEQANKIALDVCTNILSEPIITDQYATILNHFISLKGFKLTYDEKYSKNISDWTIYNTTKQFEFEWEKKGDEKLQISSLTVFETKPIMMKLNELLTKQTKTHNIMEYVKYMYKLVSSYQYNINNINNISSLSSNKSFSIPSEDAITDMYGRLFMKYVISGNEQDDEFYSIEITMVDMFLVTVYQIIQEIYIILKKEVLTGKINLKFVILCFLNIVARVVHKFDIIKADEINIVLMQDSYLQPDRYENIKRTIKNEIEIETDLYIPVSINVSDHIKYVSKYQKYILSFAKFFDISSSNYMNSTIESSAKFNKNIEIWELNREFHITADIEDENNIFSVVKDEQYDTKKLLYFVFNLFGLSEITPSSYPHELTSSLN